MAENDAMEGKDLAIKEKREFEEKVLEAIQNLKEGQTTISTEGLEVTNNKDNYIIKLKGIPFGLISKDGKFTYSKENFRQVKEALAEEGIALEDLGLPDVEEWIDQEEKQKEEEQKDEKDLSKDMGEKEEDQKETEEEKKDNDKEQEEKPKEQKKNLIKLNDKVIKILCPSAKEYGGIYLDPDRGEIVGKNRSTHEIEPVKGLSQIKGTSSNKNIHGMEDGKHKHVNALRMYQIDSRPNTGFSITRDGTEKGNFDVKFTTRKVDSNDIRDFAYVDIPLLASQERMGEGRVREVSGERQGKRGQGEQDRVQDEVDELNEEIEVPEDIVNSFNSEMQKQSNNIASLKQFKDMLQKVVKERLDKERPNDFPDSHNAHAKAIVDAMVEENKDYEQAKNEIYDTIGNNEEGNGQREEYVGYGQKRSH